LCISSSKTNISYEDGIEDSRENTEVLMMLTVCQWKLSLKKSNENEQNKRGDKNKEDIPHSDSSVIEKTFKGACPQVVSEGDIPL
jgi:hypothetical protein